MRDEGVDEKHILSQHNFRKAIALAWIDPENHLPMGRERRQKYRARTTPAKLSEARRSVRKDESKKNDKHRSEQFTDKTVGPAGRLTVTRLDPSLNHLPVPSGEKSRCSLHRWLGIETQKDLMKCEACNISVCVRCYYCFHTIEDLLGQKEKLRIFYKNDANNKKTAMDCCGNVPISTIRTPPQDQDISEESSFGSYGSRKRERAWNGATHMEAI
jgi:hypothetical protein